MQYSNTITLRLWGRYALFSDPVTRVGGEKHSYPVPTYQAVKEFWKACIGNLHSSGCRTQSVS